MDLARAALILDDALFALDSIQYVGRTFLIHGTVDAPVRNRTRLGPRREVVEVILHIEQVQHVFVDDADGTGELVLDDLQRTSDMITTLVGVSGNRVVISTLAHEVAVEFPGRPDLLTG